MMTSWRKERVWRTTVYFTFNSFNRNRLLPVFFGSGLLSEQCSLLTPLTVLPFRIARRLTRTTNVIRPVRRGCVLGSVERHTLSIPKQSQLSLTFLVRKYLYIMVGRYRCLCLGSFDSIFCVCVCLCVWWLVVFGSLGFDEPTHIPLRSLIRGSRYTNDPRNKGSLTLF